MLGNQKGKVGVFRLLGGILVAVAVDGDDAVGILVDHGALGVHAEGADLILILLGAVDNLALVELIGQVGEYHRRQLHTDADVHPVGLGGDLHLPADLLHPLAAAAAYGDDALLAGIGRAVAPDLVTAAYAADAPDRGIKVEVHLVLKERVQVFQHHIVDVGAQMAHGGIQQVQVVLNADGLKLGAGGGIEPGARAAVGHVDVIYIFHQVQGPLLADILVEGAAEIVGDVVFSVGKSPRAAEAGHDGAALAANTALDGGAVDGAGPLVQGMTGLKNADLQAGRPQHQLVRRKNAAGTGANNKHIIVHNVPFSCRSLDIWG